MKKTFWVFSILLTLPLAHFAYAQFGKTTGSRFYGDFNPVVGGWSEYQMKAKNEPPSKMKIAIVGKEGDAYWYETVVEGQREGRTITKMLISGNPEDQKNVKRIIIKTGNEPAMEMPVMMMKQDVRSQEQRGRVVDKGTETIKVPAGTFTTKHLQYQEGNEVVDTWVYKDISPYGVIKSQSKDFEMVLIGYGTGAKTLITETPKKFEMPKMPKGFPKGMVPGKDDDD
jgi:hypothetical protein